MNEARKVNDPKINPYEMSFLKRCIAMGFLIGTLLLIVPLSFMEDQIYKWKN